MNMQTPVAIIPPRTFKRWCMGRVLSVIDSGDYHVSFKLEYSFNSGFEDEAQHGPFLTSCHSLFADCRATCSQVLLPQSIMMVAADGEMFSNLILASLDSTLKRLLSSIS